MKDHPGPPAAATRRQRDRTGARELTAAKVVALGAALAVAALVLLLGAPVQAEGAPAGRHSRDKATLVAGEARESLTQWDGEGPRRRRERNSRRSWDQAALGALRSARDRAPVAGCDWSPSFGFGGLDGPVFAQATFDDGTGEALYVGGDFLTAGGVPVFGIARWDGTSWSALGSGMDDIVFALAVFDDGSGEALYAGGFFTTAGGVPAVGIAKWDGASWSAVGGGVDDAVFAFGVFDDGGGGGPALYAGGFFATAGATPADNIAKWDGTAWSALDLGVNDEVDTLAVFDDGGGDALYVGGFFDAAGGTPADYIAQWDGTSWSPVGLGMSDGVVALEVFGGALHAGGFFAFAEGNLVFGIAVWDGLTWSDLDGGMDAPVLALTTYDDDGGPALYAGGFFFVAGSVPVVSPGVARWDGMSWSAVGLGVGGSFFAGVDSLGVFDDGGGPALYAGGFFFEAGGLPARYLASWDGSAWSAVLATGPNFLGMDDVVYALLVFDDGSGPALYAGGDFLTAGGVAVNGIAKWDGTSWSPLGSGMDCEGLPFPFPGARTAGMAKGIIFSGCEFPSVQALAVYDDGSGPALYAGGIFDSAGGVPASNIAKWDGTSWSALDGGTDDIVEALAVYDAGGGPELYAGGEFLDAGGVAVSRIARWNGTAWSDVDGGVDDGVETLVVYDDGGGPDLYAGGEFGFAGGAPASFVARWDGSVWSALGLGMDDEVETLVVYNDGGGPDLYAGGQFDTAGGVPAPSIARWDGTVWSGVGLGMSTLAPFRTVDALAAFDDGTGPALYAGGFFEFAGGVPAANTARWAGAGWSPLGAGTDEEVEALAPFGKNGPSLYAGGFFGFAGGYPSSFLAEWRCPPAELAIDDVALAEGDVGTTDFVFTISRTHNANPVTVDTTTADGTATAPADYAALPLQTVSFAAGGALTQTVTVAVTADTLEEVPQKSFFVDLSSVMGAVLIDAQGLGTILDDDDDGPPAVLLVDSTAGTGDGDLEECEEARVAVSRLHVVFDRAVRDPAGDSAPDDVTNPANYRLFAAGADHDIGSAACGVPLGDDLSVSVAAVAYDAGAHTATLDVGGGVSLGDAPYRLVVCDSILDAAGNGLAGGDFTRTFRVERKNLFTNGHFDCDLDSWSAASTAPAEITHAPADVDGASVSGSAAVTNLTTSTRFSLSQCVAVKGGVDYLLGGAIRLAAAPGVVLFLNRNCALHAMPACGGAPLLTAVDLFSVADTAGAWEAIESTFTPPAVAVSARCSFDFVTPGAQSFVGGLDELTLELTPAGAAIFADGFESGDTSAWSMTVP